MEQKVRVEEIIELGGDWTTTGIGRQLVKLMDLMNELPATVGRLTIDCTGIASIDLYGYQILTVWICCLQDNDISLRFANLPAEVENSLRRISSDNRASGLYFMGMGPGRFGHGFGRCDITV